MPELPDHGLTRIACACGVFDGIHLGHQKILQTLRQEAEQKKAAPVVITFSPHPRSVLEGKEGPGLLISEAHKLKLLEQQGIAATIILPFSQQLAAQPPREFARDIFFHCPPKIVSICIGENWRFGIQASGTAKLLAELGQKAGINVIRVPLQSMGNEIVSSSRIRLLLQQGDLESCRKLLGHRFSIYGPVTHGRGIAAGDLHCPTANLQPGNQIFPPSGIYAATAKLHFTSDAPCLPGVCYLGYAPTFPGIKHEKPAVEMHLFDFHNDLYGQKIEIFPIVRLREDRRFDSVHELARQITLDLTAARKILAKEIQTSPLEL